MGEKKSWERIAGANIDETILCNPQSAKVRYANREITYITVFQHEDERDVTVEVQYSSGFSAMWKTMYIDVAFCMLWGIPLSLHCKQIYTPQVNGGVYCLSAGDGSLLWKTKSREHFKNIMVNTDETLCCAAGNNRIVVLDSVSGNEICSRKVSFDNQFTVLGDNKILVEATASKWYVLDSQTLKTIEMIQKKDINSAQEQEIWKRIFRGWDSIYKDDKEAEGTEYENHF